ncbi:hypothetical protein PspLS_05295 [Pyricularia sp. CBS 133598]|nr:hypothetical protein PspLS_05295 [Pyricularia sp. CBS 133598]
MPRLRSGQPALGSGQEQKSTAAKQRFEAKQDSAPLKRFVEISGDQHAESPHGAGVCVPASVAPREFALPVCPTAG